MNPITLRTNLVYSNLLRETQAFATQTTEENDDHVYHLANSLNQNIHRSVSRFINKSSRMIQVEQYDPYWTASDKNTARERIRTTG